MKLDAKKLLRRFIIITIVCMFYGAGMIHARYIVTECSLVVINLVNILVGIFAAIFAAYIDKLK